MEKGFRASDGSGKEKQRKKKNKTQRRGLIISRAYYKAIHWRLVSNM